MPYRIRRFGSEINLAFIPPADVDLAVPTAPHSIGTIMQHYALPWVRAANCAYFNPGTGQGLGAIWNYGNAYSTYPADWPTLVLENGALTLREDGQASFTSAQFACSGGPMLLRNGQVTEIDQEIIDHGFTGFNDGVKNAQTGVGLRPDGLLVHVTAGNLTLTELAQVMQLAGCTFGMKYDSGGSTTLYTSDGSNQTLEFGSDSRLFPCALVMRSEVSAPADANLGPFPDVPTDAWYALAVQELKEDGIVQGYPDGLFRPDAHLTRAEMTALLQRFKRLLGL